jgi:threonine dehydratase
MRTGTHPGIADIEAARERIAGVARVTPVYGSDTLSRLIGRELHLKAENQQRTGAFKVRGAVNKLLTLSREEREAGVVAASAGNHGQAVAWAARQAGARATIFVPQDAPMTKVDATRNYGADVEFVGASIEETLTAAMARVEETGATFVHPFEDETIIAGQGTIGLELAEQVPDSGGTFVVPIGGGGLAAGIALALRARRPGARIVGVRASATLPGGPGFSIADGVAVKEPGELTMAILGETLDDIVAVSDDEIAEAIVLLLERTKLLVEGAGAVGLAALLAGRAGGAGTAVTVLSGGNIDPTSLISVMHHGLTVAGRYLVVRTQLPDRPGELAKLLERLGRERVNIVSIGHHREGLDVRVGETGVELTLLTRDRSHGDDIAEAMRCWGYRVDRLS